MPTTLASPWLESGQSRRLATFGALAIVISLPMAVGCAQLTGSGSSDPSVGTAPTDTPIATPTPTSSPTTDSSPTLAPISLAGQIAFHWTVDGKTDIYLRNLDRTGLVRLTNDPARDYNPGWSPDGEQIVFTRDVERAGVSWTADGSEILFNRDIGAGIDIVRVDIASGALTPITDDPGDDSSFALSADGTTIAFQGDRLPGGIFLMDVDGANVRHLTGDWTKGYPMSWSPDGEYLAYSQPDGWLYLVHADGSEVTTWAEGGLGLAWRPAP